MKTPTKNWMKWGIASLVILLLAAGIARTLMNRKAQQEALAQQTAQKAEAFIELSPNDLIQTKLHELSQGLPISGTIKAVHAAFVKVRVPGELQGLTVREGDVVKAGQILARVDATEYRARVSQAQQQAQSAKAQVDIAKRVFENNRSLVNQGFISNTALDTSNANLAAAQANFEAAQAGADVAKKSLEDTVLRAPISGVVSQRLAQTGERVGVDTRVLEIVDLRKLEFETSVSAHDSAQISVNQLAKLQIEGIGKTVTAKVTRINPSTTTGSRAVLLYLAIDDPSGLRQGMFGQGQLNTGRTLAMGIPLSSVRTDKPAPYVQSVSNNFVVHQTVELGARAELEGDEMVIVKGLAENATLIAGTVGLLRAGTPVKISTGAK